MDTPDPSLKALLARTIDSATSLKERARNCSDDNYSLHLSGVADAIQRVADDIAVTIAAGTAAQPLDAPAPPGARNGDPATSEKAYKALSAKTSRGAVALVFYRSAVQYREPGLTSRAAVKRAKIEHHSSPWKRVSDLKAHGIIAPTGTSVRGDRGMEHDQLAITDHGIAEVERLMPTEAAAIQAARS